MATIRIHDRLWMGPVCALWAMLAAAPIAAQSYQDLHDFDCPTGCAPAGRLIQGSNGNLYGTTGAGGANNLGTIFMVDPSGTPYSVLWNFDATTGPPTGGLTLASQDGNFYGTTGSTLFQFNPSNNVLTVLHQFNSSTEGIAQGPPVEAKDKNLYGLCSLNAKGTAYRLTVATETFAMLPNMVSGFPNGPLVSASDGFLYGATANGGSSEAGLVFRMSTTGTIKKMYTFLDLSDGDNPNAPLVQGVKDGNLYGTAYSGGYNANGRYGTIFEITLPGDFFSTVFNFDGTSGGGSNPAAGLLSASDGNFYGTTYLGGASNVGTIFQQQSGGSTIPLFDFSGDVGPTPGASPNTALMEDTNGLFYGLTSAGGAHGGGVFYTVAPANPFSHISLCCNWWVILDQPVTILGQNLTGVVNVAFGSVQARFQPGSAAYLTAYVPSLAIDAPVTVTLATGLQLESVQPARILPKISNLDPLSGAPGTRINLTGGGFAGATLVTFAGTPASFTVVTPALIQVTVPAGAKTGHVGVETPNGTSHSKQIFTVN